MHFEIAHYDMNNGTNNIQKHAGFCMVGCREITVILDKECITKVGNREKEQMEDAEAALPFWKKERHAGG